MILETGSLVEKSPEQRTWRRFGSMVSHGLIREQDINPSTGEINYAGLRANLQHKKYAKYADVIDFLEKRGPNGYTFRADQKLRQAKQAWSEIYNDPDINPNVNNSYSVLSVEPKMKEVVPLPETTETAIAEVPEVLAAAADNESTEAGIGAFINLKKMITDVKEKYFVFSKVVDAQDTLEKRKKGRLYRRQGLSWSPYFDEVAAMDIRLRKDSLRHGPSLRNLLRPLARPVAGLLAFSTLVVTAHSAASNQDLNWGFNPARSGTDESAHLIVAEPLPAPVLDVVLPASAAEPVNPEPLAKAEAPAGVMKEVIVDRSIAQTLVNEGHLIDYSPGDLHFSDAMDSFGQFAEDNFDKLQQYNREMGGSYFPANIAELRTLVNRAKVDPDEREKFLNALGKVPRGITMIVRISNPANQNTAGAAVSN